MRFASQRKSRKVRYCDNCRARIEVGQVYWRHTATPRDEIMDCDGWSTLITCGQYTSDCVRYWEIDSRVMSKDPELVIL